MLIRGHGKPLQNGQPDDVRGTGVVWRTGKVPDSGSAWPAGRQPGAAHPAPRPGYGQAGGPPDVGGHDTLVFVIGILAAV